MSRKHNRRAAGRPPDGEPWVWHTLALLSSPAWRERSVSCMRLIDFLEIEHLQHGGNENGSLVAPYSQLVQFSISRRLISGAIREAERRGLVDVERGGKKGTAMTELSRYRLTYLWTKSRKGGLWDWHAPTDEWKTVESASIGSTSGTALVPHRELVPVPLRELPGSQTIEITRSSVVPFLEPPSISWGGEPLRARERAAAALTSQAEARDRESKSIGPVRQHGP